MSEERPADPFSLMRRADVLLDVGRSEEAAALLRQALSSDPDNPYAYVRLASALLEAESPRDALEASEAAIQRAPDLEAGHRLRALALLELEKKRAALEAAREAVRLAPDYPHALYTLVRSLLANRKRREANKIAERARSLAPDDPDAHHMMGLVQLELHKWKDAEAHYRKALSIAPGHAVSINNLGVALRAQGRHKEALELFTAAAKTDPKISEARENVYSAAKVGLPLFGLWIFLRVLSGLENANVATPVIVVLLLLGLGGYLYWRKRHLDQVPEDARRYVVHESRRRRPITLWRWAVFISSASALAGTLFAVLYVVILQAADAVLIVLVVWAAVSLAAVAGARYGLDRARSKI